MSIAHPSKEFVMARTRLQISMSSELEQALRELQDATGLAMASFVSEVMEHNVASIYAVAEAARRSKADVGMWLVEMLNENTRKKLAELNGETAEVVEPVVRPVRSYKRRVRPGKVTHGKA